MTTQMQRKARRQKARDVKAQYDAAGSGRRLRGWSPPSTGPNRALAGFAKIRSRALDVVRNDWSGESSVQKWTTTLIGVGIVPRWDDEDWLTELWSEWGRVADADGVLDVYGQQALGIRSWLAAGEVFVRRRPRNLLMNLPVPLQVQLIESDYCPIFDADQWPGMPTGNRIRQGIELTRYGERAAYWMHKEHPNDGAGGFKQEDLIRIPAREVRHVYEPKRAGQLRGVTSLAPILARLRATGDFEDAVLDRQKLANLFTLFITRSLPEDWSDLDVDPDTGLPKWYDGDGQPMAGLEPGLAQELKPGEDVKFANPPEAGVSFSDYLRTTNLGTSAGQGLPYELFSGDIANVSDRTLRVVIQEFRRFAEQRQWHVVIPMMCQPIVEWFVDAGILAGVIPLAKQKKAKNPEHSPHGWDYIHPVQDVEGKILAIEAGLSSRTRAITARGDVPSKIDQERADDQAREKSLGITPAQPKAGKPGQEPQQQPPQASLDLTGLLGAVSQMMTSMQAVLGQFAQFQMAAPQGPQAAQAPVIHNHLPAPVVNVAPAAAPEIHNHLPAPVVNVAPAEVTVTNSVQAPEVHNHLPAPLVNVAPAEVTVTNNLPAPEVTVNLPDRETKSVIKRDSRGDIVDVTQIERTLN